MDSRKSIKIESSTDEILIEIKKKYNLHSRDEAIQFLRYNLKSPQELLLDDLKPLKEHLIELDRPDVYDIIHDIIIPLTIDPRFAIALARIKTWDKGGGGVSNGDIRRAFGDAGIHKHEYDRFFIELKKIGVD